MKNGFDLDDMKRNFTIENEDPKKATDKSISTRPRVTKHGGGIIQATGNK